MNVWEEEEEGKVKGLNANNGYISPKGILCLAVVRKYRPQPLSRSQKSESSRRSGKKGKEGCKGA